MEQRSDPTTEKVVRALRELAYKAERDGVTSLPCTIDLMLAWATDLEKTSSALSDCTDRLESQQREIERLKAEAFANAVESAERIANLTAERDAEKARADAAVADLKFGRICMTCKHDEKCRKEVSETNQTQCINKQRWQWRGEKGKDGTDGN